MLKKLLIGFIYLISIKSYASDSLPMFYDNISISGIESWPDAPDKTSGFMVRMTAPLTGPGCDNTTIFSVKGGDYQGQTLSILLAVMMANKKIRIRVSECSDRSLVDRVEIIN